MRLVRGWLSCSRNTSKIIGLEAAGMAQLCTLYWLIWTLYTPPFKTVPSIYFDHFDPRIYYFSLFNLAGLAPMDPQPMMLAWGKSQRNHTEHIAFIVLLIFQLIYTFTWKMEKLGKIWMIYIYNITLHIYIIHMHQYIYIIQNTVLIQVLLWHANKWRYSIIQSKFRLQLRSR